MFWRKPMEGTPAYKPKGYPDGATPLLPIQRLPLLLLPMLDGRAGRGKDGTWWPDNKSQRLPCLSPESPYAPRDRGTVRALLLPPLLPSSSAREAGARGNRQPKDHDNRDTLGSLLRELLPHKFSRFLNKLRAKSVDPEADREAAGGGGGSGGVRSRVPNRGLSPSHRALLLPLLFSFLLFLSPPSTLSATVPQEYIRSLPSFSVFQLLIPPGPVVSREDPFDEGRVALGATMVGLCLHQLWPLSLQGTNHCKGTTVLERRLPWGSQKVNSSEPKRPIRE